MEEVRSLLWMIMVLGAGNPLIWKLLQQHRTPQKAAYILAHPETDDQLHLPEYVQRRLRQVSSEKVDEMLEMCEKMQQSILWYGDDAYPERLLSIENPPTLLFYQGDVSLLQDHLLLTIVGTRNPTDYTLRIEKWICRELVEVGFVPVTGFAVGVDITANYCAMEQEKPSIALMGCGLDQFYPHQHAAIKPKLAAQGLLLSEFLPGTAPKAANFPLRNRVLSGISMGTFVVQAPLRSGALITAENALEQGRDVFCIPPADITDRRYLGVVKYLRDGAIPVFQSQDILYEYYTMHAHMLTASALYTLNSRKSESMVMTLGQDETADLDRKKKKKARQKQDLPEEPEQSAETALSQAVPTAEMDAFETAETFQMAEEELSLLSRTVLAQMRSRPVVHIDYLASVLDVSMQTLNAALTELEIYGYLEHLPGKQFRLHQ